VRLLGRNKSNGRGSDRSELVRIFFCTDLHGSDVCFRKFLHAGQVYEADVVIMGGDCTGKMVIPVVETDRGEFEIEWVGASHTLGEGEELADIERQIANAGLYPVRVSEQRMEQLAADPDLLKKTFHEAMCSRLQGWLDLAEERLADSGLEVIFTPGNDDEFDIDPVLEGSKFVSTPEGRIERIGDGRFEMLNLAWSNTTPWDTPRECTEETLAEKIAALAERIESMENAIFNIHVPPYGTGLDNAPELANGQSMKRGGAVSVPVGSYAVRDAILSYQPLLSLHGHIHESRAIQELDRTVSVNPGSAYSDWTLQGVLVDLEEGKVARYVPVTG
jgi:Icc-related predicted phosphoesterase